MKYGVQKVSAINYAMKFYFSIRQMEIQFRFKFSQQQ